MNNAEQVETNLPLTETTYFIMLILANGPRHGYAIMKEVNQLSQGRVQLSTGTLYGALKRLLDHGWIRRAEDSESGATGRVRKLYSLTPLGRQILEAEVHRLHSLAKAAEKRLLSDPA
jgi:DNA-binding PadR family transcriptional regulator